MMKGDPGAQLVLAEGNHNAPTSRVSRELRERKVLTYNNSGL
jgi:hypothetical protein